MQFPRWFRRMRAWVFLLATIISLTLCTALCVFLFKLYDRTDTAQRNVVGVLVFSDAITPLILPALLIFEFRPWLDAARIAFLIIAHVGPAMLVTLWNSTFICPTDASQRKVCKDVSLAIVICSWIVPAILVSYSACLVVMCYSNRSEESVEDDLPPSRPPSSWVDRTSISSELLNVSQGKRRDSDVPQDPPSKKNGFLNFSRRRSPDVQNKRSSSFYAPDMFTQQPPPRAHIPPVPLRDSVYPENWRYAEAPPPVPPLPEMYRRAEPPAPPSPYAGLSEAFHPRSYKRNTESSQYSVGSDVVDRPGRRSRRLSKSTRPISEIY